MPEPCWFECGGEIVEVLCAACRGTGIVMSDWCGECGGPGRWSTCTTVASLVHVAAEERVEEPTDA
jgi:DnaJ-class molecular chaperone